MLKWALISELKGEWPYNMILISSKFKLILKESNLNMLSFAITYKKEYAD